MLQGTKIPELMYVKSFAEQHSAIRTSTCYPPLNPPSPKPARNRWRLDEDQKVHLEKLWKAAIALRVTGKGVFKKEGWPISCGDLAAYSPREEGAAIQD